MYIAKNLYKTYYVKKKKGFNFFTKAEPIFAVQDVSLNIEKGKIIGLLGINGAGKTTTIKMLSTMISPTQGQITVDGVNAVENDIDIKKKINVISGGERNIYWRLSAWENLEYFGSLYGLYGKTLTDRINNILNIVQLTDAKDLPVERYSKGMKQRLQIARGLINSPDYIFLDEPTLGLDVMIAHELRNYIKKLSFNGKGILLTTHYMKEAEELCDYIYIIDNGRIIYEGTPNKIKENFSNNLVTEFILNFIPSNIEDELKSIPGVLKINIKQELYLISVVSDFAIVTPIVNKLTEYKDVSVLKIIVQQSNLEDSIINAVDRLSNKY